MPAGLDPTYNRYSDGMGDLPLRVISFSPATGVEGTSSSACSTSTFPPVPEVVEPRVRPSKGSSSKGVTFAPRCGQACDRSCDQGGVCTDGGRRVDPRGSPSCPSGESSHGAAVKRTELEETEGKQPRPGKFCCVCHNGTPRSCGNMECRRWCCERCLIKTNLENIWRCPCCIAQKPYQSGQSEVDTRPVLAWASPWDSGERARRLNKG